MIRVCVTEDNNGHEYIIPYKMKEEFDNLLNEFENTEDWSILNKFNEKFYRYAILVDYNSVELYADIK